MSSLYFDNAATSYPKPTEVYKACCNALLYCGGNPGRSNHDLSLQSARAVYEAREAVSELLNFYDPSRVVFAPNATYALNTAILGIPGIGGKIIISDMEHNAVLRAVAEKCRRDGASYEVFRTYDGDDRKTLASLENHLNENCRAVVINAASNVDGRILPIKAISKLCKQSNIPVIIDASQLLPHRIIDATEIDFTFLCCAGHKGLLSPMGCGFSLLGKNAEQFTPLTFGGNGINSMELFMGDELPERYESGTLPVPAIAGLSAGVRFVMKHGKEIEEHTRAITDKIIDKLSEIKGVRVFHSNCGCPVISFTAEGISSDLVAEMLSKRGICVRSGLHCAPLAHCTLGTENGGTVRISPYFANTEIDCNHLIKAICELK